MTWQLIQTNTAVAPMCLCIMYKHYSVPKVPNLSKVKLVRIHIWLHVFMNFLLFHRFTSSSVRFVAFVDKPCLSFGFLFTIWCSPSGWWPFVFSLLYVMQRLKHKSVTCGWLIIIAFRSVAFSELRFDCWVSPLSTSFFGNHSQTICFYSHNILLTNY